MADGFAYLFRHHAWATAALIEFCGRLPGDLAHASAPGTYGSILSTLGHLVGTDEFSAFLATGLRPERPLRPDQPYDLRDLGRHAEEVQGRWATLFRGPVALDRVVELPPESRTRTATLRVILLQALTHAAEHRTQVATVLGHHGVEPPELIGWTFGASTGELEPR